VAKSKEDQYFFYTFTEKMSMLTAGVITPEEFKKSTTFA
jgi:uncharacterized protein YfkK (UPF0435 family)